MAEEFQSRIQYILDNLDNVLLIAKSESAQKIHAEMNFRIFAQGEAANNEPIGKYNIHFSLNGEKYIETRRKAGLQTDFVDLTFSTSLQKSIKNEENKIFFQNTYGVTISAANERNFGKIIFRASKPERQIYFDTLDEEMNKLIRGQ